RFVVIAVGILTQSALPGAFAFLSGADLRPRRRFTEVFRGDDTSATRAAFFTAYELSKFKSLISLLRFFHIDPVPCQYIGLRDGVRGRGSCIIIGRIRTRGFVDIYTNVFRLSSFDDFCTNHIVRACAARSTGCAAVVVIGGTVATIIKS